LHPRAARLPDCSLGLAALGPLPSPALGLVFFWGGVEVFEILGAAKNGKRRSLNKVVGKVRGDPGRCPALHCVSPVENKQKTKIWSQFSLIFSDLFIFCAFPRRAGAQPPRRCPAALGGPVPRSRPRVRLRPRRETPGPGQCVPAGVGVRGRA